MTGGKKEEKNAVGMRRCDEIGDGSGRLEFRGGSNTVERTGEEKRGLAGWLAGAARWAALCLPWRARSFGGARPHYTGTGQAGIGGLAKLVVR